MRAGYLFEKLLLALDTDRWFLYSAIFFRIVLDIGYIEIVSPTFSSIGFMLDINVGKYFESWVLYITLIIAFPRRLNKASDYLMAYMLFSFLTPLLVFYGLSNATREYLYSVLLAVTFITVFRTGRPLNLPAIKGSRFLAHLIIGIGVVFVTGWMIYSGGLSFFNLDFSKVYDLRRDVGNLINEGLMAYLNVWAYNVFGPVLLTLALWKKNYVLAAIVIGLHVVWFGISSHKGVLFYPFVIIFIWFWFGKFRGLAIIPLGMAGVVVFSSLAFIVFDETWLSSLFLYRVFFVPPFLTFTYFEFFSINPFVYWSESILSKFIDYPYDLGTAELIGRHLENGYFANNSFLSTGYMHAGHPGMIFYGVLAGLLFRLIDSVSTKRIPTWVAVSIVIIPTNSLITSTDLPTALLSHGIGISVFILFLLRTSANIPSAIRKPLAKVGQV